MKTSSKHDHRSPARRLRLLYMAVLSTVTVLSITGQVFIRRALTQQANNSRLVSIAARQWMLSQKMREAALALQSSADAAERQKHTAQLRQPLQVWKRSHLGLRYGDEEWGLPGANSPQVTQLFTRIEPHYQVLLQAIENLLEAALQNTTGSSPETDLAPLVRNALTAEAAFFKGVNEIVFQYDREARRHVVRLEQIEQGFFALFITILLAGILVLRLAVKKVDQTIIEVEQAEQTLSAVLNTVGEGIVTIDSTGAMVMVNQEVQGIWSYRQGELIGQDLRMLMAENSFVKGNGEIDLAHMLGQRLELEGLRKDGSAFPLEIRITETKIGKQMLFTAAVRDITERKQAQQRQAQLMKELKRSNQELRDFAYVVSHDLKAPLRAIGSLTAWLATDYADKLDEKGQNLISLLVGRVKRMEGLIDGILQYSRLGRIREKKMVVDLNRSVPAVIDMITPPENIEIVIEDELPSVVGEKTRLEQVFQNLLSNAIKFMDKPKGKIRVGCAARNGYWQFEVADNGPGIEEKYFAKIFQIFQTLSSRDEFESSGIGLTVVRRIVEMYGGKIWLKSNVGEGTTFFFTLPSQESDSSESQTVGGQT